MLDGIGGDDYGHAERQTPGRPQNGGAGPAHRRARGCGPPARRSPQHAGFAAASAMAHGRRPVVAVPDADAQIYTRKNEHGVIEATNVPAERDYQLTYPGKGTLIHSAAWRLRPNYNGEYDHHIAAAAGTHGVSVAARARGHPGGVRLRLAGPLLQGRAGPDAAHARHRAPARASATPSIPRQNIFGGRALPAHPARHVPGRRLPGHRRLQRGARTVQRYGGVPPFKETRNYVAKIQSLLSGLGAPMVTAASAQHDVVRARRQSVRRQGARGRGDRRRGQAAGQADAGAAQDLLPLEGCLRRAPTSPRSRPQRVSSTRRSALSTNAP